MHDGLIGARRRNTIRAALDETGLYHSFRLPEGQVLPEAMSLEYQEERLASFQLPDDLDGKRVLDIGPWDGFYTFEMERRGASVTAVDYVDLDTFRGLHRLMGSNAVYLQMEAYEITPQALGTFDIVLCLGVLYHLKYPLLGLEKICAVTQDLCVLESFVVDGGTYSEGQQTGLPYCEFYERGELGGQLDNWWGPTVSAVVGLARAAGFAQAEVVRVTDASAIILARRKWTNLPPELREEWEIAGVTCHTNRGRSFQSGKEQYVQLWCSGNSTVLETVDSVYPEVDGFGIAPLSCTPTPSGLLISFRLPPGLSPGEHGVRVKIGDSKWSTSACLYVDLPVMEGSLTIDSVQDGKSWSVDQVDWGQGGWLTVWVKGLSNEADPGNTIVFIGELPHHPEYVDPRSGQINVRLRPIVAPGTLNLYVAHRGLRSNTQRLRISGDPPPVKGLPSPPARQE